ncbi:unnamed protein product [Adineta ricciae]|uniref:Uncharacterized protein n=1 Tax=Adineta ricciae TaxID=249248 RepID=A0A814QZ90_ADIRI|nr:unnamed protein product [Adineta ricciae]CAF1126216.1 unnamed protein product [Adineta ricciae]
MEHTNDESGKRIFIPAIGSLGDVKPYLTLAKELKKQGYVVWLGVHKRFEQQIRDNGIDTVEIGGDMEIALSTTPEGIELQRNPSVFKIGLVKRVFLPLVEEWFTGILSGLKNADLIILSITSIIAGLACVEKYHNVKAVGIYTYPCRPSVEFAPPALSGKSESLFGWINSLKWKLFEYGASNMYTERINQLRGNINLPPTKLYYDEMVRSIFKKPLPTVTIYSKGLLRQPSDWPGNELMVGPVLSEDENTDYHPSEELRDFLNKWQSEKIIYIGIGSMMGIMFNNNEQLQFLLHIENVIQAIKCKAIISLAGFGISNNDKLSDHNENLFYLREMIPHTWLFPKISAVVHHGGAGTTHTGLRYALPTLVLPFGADQPFNGDRVFINKLGPRPIPIRAMNARSLKNGIECLLNNYAEYRANAEKVGQMIQNENGLGCCLELIKNELNS